MRSGYQNQAGCMQCVAVKTRKAASWQGDAGCQDQEGCIRCLAVKCSPFGKQAMPKLSANRRHRARLED